MKKSKLLILTLLLLFGCNTGDLSNDNSSEFLSNVVSSEEIYSNGVVSSDKSSTYSIDYSDLKILKSYFIYEYIDYSKTGNYYSNFGLLEKAGPYLSNIPIDVELDYEKPDFIIYGDYLEISYYGEIEMLPKELMMPPAYPGDTCKIHGEIVNVKYVRCNIEVMTYEDIINEGIEFIMFDEDYSFCEISESYKDSVLYVAKTESGEVVKKFAYTFNPLEI